MNDLDTLTGSDSRKATIRINIPFRTRKSAMAFLDRFNKMPIRHGLPSVTMLEESSLYVTKSGQISVDYPDARSLLSFIEKYSAEKSLQSQKTLAQLYRSEFDPEISSWKVEPLRGSHTTTRGAMGVSGNQYDRQHPHRSVPASSQHLPRNAPPPFLQRPRLASRKPLVAQSYWQSHGERLARNPSIDR